MGGGEGVGTWIGMNNEKNIVFLFKKQRADMVIMSIHSNRNSN